MYRSFPNSNLVLLQKEGEIFLRRGLQAFWGQERAQGAQPEEASHRFSLLTSHF